MCSEHASGCLVVNPRAGRGSRVAKQSADGAVNTYMKGGEDKQSTLEG